MHTKLEEPILDHTKIFSICKQGKSPECIPVVAPYRSLPLDLHEEKHSSHPSSRLTNLGRQQERAQGVWNPSWQQRKRSQNNQSLQRVKIPWPQDVPCKCHPASSCTTIYTEQVSSREAGAPGAMLNSFSKNSTPSASPPSTYPSLEMP